MPEFAHVSYVSRHITSKVETVTDISKLCNCQAHDVWFMQRIEYLAACEKDGKNVPNSFYVTGEPVPAE